ncbi:hypothetical protein [Reticulibacter mediterranei]|uniref:hypothetical protein n=1 Tax=Reticulibacter mediterranei TaxID=2778369 RepID=UPI001C68AB87|nr:hypothetical protein [Reticulibacter mediterranei]
MTYQQKLRRWQELEEESARVEVQPGIRETVVALQALGIHTVEASEGYPDKEPLFPYVKVAIPEYEQEAQRVEQADQEAKQARNLLSRFQRADEGKKAELQDRVPSREEVIHQARVTTEMRHTLLEKHLPIITQLFVHLTAFYQDRAISFDCALVVTTNGIGRVIVRSQGAILQADRTPEEQAHHFQAYQSEMKEFTAFLKQLYFSSSDQ